MKDETLEKNEDIFDLDFLSKESSNQEPSIKGFYKILITDDEEDVHVITKMIFKNFVLDDKALSFLDAYSAEEAQIILKEHDDIAVILLDVVMEETDSGLKVVEYLRKTLDNKKTRIILRTGQPGQAPEESLIRDYDINDYKLKTELTKQKLYTTMYSCLRSYRDIMLIQKTKEAFEKMVIISENLFKQNSLEDFLNSIFEQLVLFQYSDNNSLFVCEESCQSTDGFIYRKQRSAHVIVAATGKYKPYVGFGLEAVQALEDIQEDIRNIQENGRSVVKLEKGFVFFNKGNNGIRNYVYIETDNDLYDYNLIELFLSSYSLALDNFHLNQLMASSQESIMFILSETIEQHFEENSNHVRRVSALMHLLGEKSGLSRMECETLRVASVLHDIGKIGIPDDILKKPGKLTTEEFETIKSHCLTGYNILKNAQQDTFIVAAEIAYYHHEKFDGSGYPKGYIGNEIPLYARMMAIVDVFDALVHRRCYKDAFPVSEALEMMKRERGRHFDPELLDLFLSNINLVLNAIEDLKD